MGKWNWPTVRATPPSFHMIMIKYWALHLVKPMQIPSLSKKECCILNWKVSKPMLFIFSRHFFSQT